MQFKKNFKYKNAKSKKYFFIFFKFKKIREI
jgi:hypothetical protein